MSSYYNGSQEREWPGSEPEEETTMTNDFASRVAGDAALIADAAIAEYEKREAQ